MRKGFTMIELIFVIVILGILAAVAIPRLAATRDDAQVAKISSNLATVIADAGARWTAQGSWPTNWTDMTNVPLTTEAGGTTASTVTTAPAFLNAGTNGATDGCYQLALNATGGTISVTALAAATSAACDGAKKATAANNLSDKTDGTAKAHTFGGSSVKF